MTCETCKYWQPVGGREKLGECRINPPVANLYGVLGSFNRDALRRNVGLFPITEPGDWCGQWTANPEPDGGIGLA